MLTLEYNHLIMNVLQNINKTLIKSLQLNNILLKFNYIETKGLI